MKFNTIFLYVTILISFCYSIEGSYPSCAAKGYCMGCSSTTANTCVSCYNWGSGNILARALVMGLCTTIMGPTIVQDCKYYSGTNDGNLQTIDNCQRCSKIWLNINSNTTTQTCSDTAINSSCTAVIPKCRQSVCYTADGATYVTRCKWCNKDYAGTGSVSQDAGFESCGAGGTISNCEFYGLLGASTLSCDSCKAGYALKSNQIKCTSFTIDANCRMLNGSNTCQYCFHSYFWNTNLCKLFTNLVAFSSISLFIALL